MFTAPLVHTLFALWPTTQSRINDILSATGEPKQTIPAVVLSWYPVKTTGVNALL